VKESKEHGETFQMVSGLTEDHLRLKPFEGTFRAEVRFWMGPGDPVVSHGTMVNRFVLGGRFLRQEFQGDASDGPFGQMPAFTGEGYWGYNTVDKRYEGTWVDNASTLIQVESGQVDANGAEWNMYSSMTNPQTGKPMEKRSIITLQDDDHHSMEMWFREPDGPEVKAMEIRYTRQRG